MYIVLLLNIEVNFHENVLFMVENKKDETRELGQEGGRKNFGRNSNICNTKDFCTDKTVARIYKVM